MRKIKFEPEGWHGVIGDDFTVSNVARIANAASVWLLNKFTRPSVVIGYDTRFEGSYFARAFAKVLAAKGVRVYFPESHGTSPMVSGGVVDLNASMGIMITAGHHPHNQNGIRFFDQNGSYFPVALQVNIEALIHDQNSMDLDLLNWDRLTGEEMIKPVDLVALYLSRLRDSGQIEPDNKSGLNVALDLMYGGSGILFPRHIKGFRVIHRKPDPLFGEIVPDPREKNLEELKGLARKDKNIQAGFAIDGDGSRLGMVDDQGKVLKPSEILMLLIHILAENSNGSGIISAGFHLSEKIEKLAGHYGFRVIRIQEKITSLAESFQQPEVMAGGTSAGCYMIDRIVPVGDAVIAALYIEQYLAKSRKKPSTLLREFKKIAGSWHISTRAVQLGKAHKNKLNELCNNDQIKQMGPYKVTAVESMDGYKLITGTGQWVVIKPETMLSVQLIAEAESETEADRIIAEATEYLSNL